MAGDGTRVVGEGESAAFVPPATPFTGRDDGHQFAPVEQDGVGKRHRAASG
jgi:hypothetical protein